MFTQTVLLVVLAGVAVAAPSDLYNVPAPHSGGHSPPHSGGYSAPHSGGYDQDQRIPYNFEYGVQDEYAGADFSQNEESDGQVTRGSYTVQLPDGRKQTVTYTVDGYSGYVAEVSYYGEAQYPHEYGPAVTFPPQQYGPEPSYQPQPSYQPPQPSYQPPQPSYQ